MFKRRCLEVVAMAMITTGLSACHRGSELELPLATGVSIELAQYRASVISDLSYGLSLSLPRSMDEDIAGHMEIGFRLADAGRPLQVDFRADPRHLLTAQVNGNSARLEFSNEHIVVPASLLRTGANTLSFEFIAGSSSLNRNPDFLYTLFVPDRARTAFPIFDQPDLKARWDLSLELPSGWKAISAAPAKEMETANGRKKIRFAPSDRISSYLFSFVAGEFETIERGISGRTMTLLHRETDAAKVARNTDEIFELHEAALEWLEDYTGIPFPYQKLDIALLPAHPYGGMEHVGAIQYRADSLWLDEGASDTQRLRRASLIAHEVAHMWFGNLVTMRWFDDVWTKEVFASFMGGKIVNPSFTEIDHDLNFLIAHHPDAYGVDRTAGANPIRQPLANLNLAGQLYGAIIYDKAPIMMRQLERLVGESAFRDGLREYLATFSHGNASWPELIRILDGYSDEDVAAWSDVWVNTAGRPHFVLAGDASARRLEQVDPQGQDRFWPQSFKIASAARHAGAPVDHEVRSASTTLPGKLSSAEEAALLLNADGYGYGLFPAQIHALDTWQELEPLALASLLVNLNEQVLELGQPTPAQYLTRLTEIALGSENQLLLDLTLDQLQHIYWTLISDEQRSRLAPELEAGLWQALQRSEGESLRKIFFEAYAKITLSPLGLDRLHEVWSGDRVISNLPFSERDAIRLAMDLAIKLPGQAQSLLQGQLEQTENPDQLRRLRFLAPALSADEAVRDAFFASLAQEKNRETESWVLDALRILHHPLRVQSSEKYILPGLELLEEIQSTGDIFFPTGWLRASLGTHHSDSAVATVDAFLEARPAFNAQLRMKLLQAADPLRRANHLRR